MGRGLALAVAGKRFGEPWCPFDRDLSHAHAEGKILLSMGSSRGSRVGPTATLDMRRARSC